MEIINHRQFRMDPIDRIIAPEVLKQAYLLDEYFVSSGTLLGLYRDQEFIEGDTDIDIDVIGYEGIGEYLFKALGHMNLIRTGYHKGRPMQTAFMYRGIIFDVWVYWRETTSRGIFMRNHNDMGVMKVPAKFFDNPEALKTRFGSFRTFGPIDGYLAFRYGDDWRIPKKSKGIYTQK